MPASVSRRSRSSSPNAATAATSKPANAARNACRLRRIVSQDRPDWNASSVRRSKRPSSARTGRPHSSSWYATYSGAPPTAQKHRGRPSGPPRARHSPAPLTRTCRAPSRAARWPASGPSRAARRPASWPSRAAPGPASWPCSISSAPCFLAFSMISAASALALSVVRLGLLAQVRGGRLGLVGPLAGRRFGLVERRARLLLDVGGGLLRLRRGVVGHLLGVVHESHCGLPPRTTMRKRLRSQCTAAALCQSSASRSPRRGRARRASSGRSYRRGVLVGLIILTRSGRPDGGRRAGSPARAAPGSGARESAVSAPSGPVGEVGQQHVESGLELAGPVPHREPHADAHHARGSRPSAR